MDLGFGFLTNEIWSSGMFLVPKKKKCIFILFFIRFFVMG